MTKAKAREATHAVFHTGSEGLRSSKPRQNKQHMWSCIKAERREEISIVVYTGTKGLRIADACRPEPMPGGATLVVTHIGRVDVLLSLLMAARSSFSPNIAGL